jgi:cytolysin (calcineurin-like family phosphatase)
VFLLIISACGTVRRNDTTFLVAADIHLDSTAVRAAVVDSVIDLMNSVNGTPVMGVAGKSYNPFGLFVIGDLTDSGSDIQWAQFTSLFGLNGEKDLAMPVFETFGNHDGKTGGVVREGITARNSARSTKVNSSPNGIHYSFDRGGIHFVVLGSYPGGVWDPECGWCHYFKESFRESEMSLEFLKSDLAMNLRSRKQPVVLFFHYGWDDFSLLWWTGKEQEAFAEAIKEYNVAAIFHGHNHSAAAYKWNGIDVFSSGSPQRGSSVGNFLIVRADGDSLSVTSLEKKREVHLGTVSLAGK